MPRLRRAIENRWRQHLVSFAKIYMLIASIAVGRFIRLPRSSAHLIQAAGTINLGVMYLAGHGVRQDYSAAALWFRKAAEQGYALAQSNLGTLHRDGRGVAQDDTEAVIWFRKAADQGDAVAEFLLGNQYANVYILVFGETRRN